MEFNSGVSMFLPDSMGLNENDFDEEDHEDIVHEQTNQNEIVELIMAAFEGHEEPSDGEEEEEDDDDDDDDDDESLNTSNSSHRINNEHELLNTNNNNNNTNMNEHYAQQQQQQQHELLHRNHLFQQPLYSTPAVSTPPPLVPPSASTDVRRFDDHNQYTFSRYQQFDEHNNTEQEIPFCSKSSALVHYQNPNRQTNNNINNNNNNTVPTGIQYFDSLPTIDLIDPMQAQFMYQTSSSSSSDIQNQLNKFRILCNVKERKITELENRCTEYHEKYNSDLRVLKHKIELSERAKYDCEQRYQSITRQCEELIETNNQLQRTTKDAELRIQQLEGNKNQLEKKLDEAESLIDSLHRKVNELQRFESIARTQQDCEMILASTREKHEQEMINLNEKVQMTQMNLQEKTIEVDELRIQLETACKNNEKAIFERMETISHLNQQLHDCQRQYTDLLTSKSMDTFNQTENKRQLNRMTEDKEKLERTCEELQAEIRTLRERLGVTEHEVNKDLFGISSIAINELSSSRQVVPHNSTSLDDPNESLLNENHHLKERIDEFASNERNLIEINEELQRQIHELTHAETLQTDETMMTNSIHMEQIHSLTNEIEKLRKDYANLQEKYDYDKHELQTIIEQLREDIVDLDKTKQLYIDVCQEKNSIEDSLRAKFEHEIKAKLDDLRRTLDKDYNDKILSHKNNLDQDSLQIKTKCTQDLEQQAKEFNQDIERIKINHEKMVNELKIELDRLRANDDAKNRLTYVEKEFEQLKHDYSDLNLKQKELLLNCKTLEDENQNLLKTIEEFDREKSQLKENEERLSNEIKELIEKQKEELNNSSKNSDESQTDLKQNIEALQIRINNYENAVSQYEEYRLKLENNLQKITQQRDTNKMDLRLAREMLTNKENEFNQFKTQFDELEKSLQIYKERSTQNETTINNLQKQIQQYEQQVFELKDIQEKEIVDREKLVALENEISQYDQRLQEANRALNLADSHLEQEIEKIKLSLEQEYNRRYERDHKQHQQELSQLRQQLTNEFEKQKNLIITNNQSNTSIQDIEEVKKMYRTEIDRLYRENIELSQSQAKLIDTHQKQMQIMKKDLDDGYNNVINEFQHEQSRLQTRCEQLKQQLSEAQLTIEQIKKNHFDEITKLKEKYTFEQDNRNRQENLQIRVDHLVKLLEQTNDTLNHERAVHAQQENEYQQTISSLQKKIADMIKQHTIVMDEIKRELHQERLSAQKRATTRSICVPQYVQTDLSLNDIKSDYMATVEKLRVGIAHYMDNLDISIKKQIQNELTRSRNSMIKEIRRELFEKMTHAMKSQGIPDTTIDMHVFELDRLLSQMAQDCLDSLSSSSSTTSSIYSTISSNSSLVTPQRRAMVYDSSASTTLTKSKTNENNFTPLRKSTECLHMTPTMHKQAAPLAPHCHITLDSDRRPKSASTILLASQNSTTPTVLSPRTHKFQRPTHRNFKMKMYKSEDDIMSAVQRHDDRQDQRSDLNSGVGGDDDDATITLCENENDERQHPQTNVRALAKQFEQKTNSLPDHNRSKLKTPDNYQTIHYATARTIISEQQEDIEDEDELTWPQQLQQQQQQQPQPQPQQHQTSSHSGIKKFVRHSLKLFTTQSQQQQQHKKTGK